MKGMYIIIIHAVQCYHHLMPPPSRKCSSSCAIVLRCHVFLIILGHQVPCLVVILGVWWFGMALFVSIIISNAFSFSQVRTSVPLFGTVAFELEGDPVGKVSKFFYPT